MFSLLMHVRVLDHINCIKHYVGDIIAGVIAGDFWYSPIFIAFLKHYFRFLTLFFVNFKHYFLNKNLNNCNIIF